jgi:hypothetical protein
MFSMCAYPLLGEVGGSWAPNGTRLSAQCQLTGPKTLSNYRAQPPPTSPPNGYALIENIMHRAV